MYKTYTFFKNQSNIKKKLSFFNFISLLKKIDFDFDSNLPSQINNKMSQEQQIEQQIVANQAENKKIDLDFDSNLPSQINNKMSQEQAIIESEVVSIKPKRKYVRKIKVVEELAPLSLVSDKEESDQESDQESDKEDSDSDEEDAEENMPIINLMEKRLTEEEEELKQAMQRVEELKKKVAINKKRENIVELRAEKVKDIDAGIEKLEQQLVSMKTRRDEILEGKLDEFILSSTFAPKEVTKKKKAVKSEKSETGKKYVRPANYAELYIPQGSELKQTIKGKVFSVIFDGKVFKGECGEHDTLRKANIAHCETLDVKWYPDAWKSFTLNGASIYRLDL